MFKTSKYEYSTSSGGGPSNGYNSIDRSSNNNYSEINKLDTLLNDLEHERTATLDRSKSNDLELLLGAPDDAMSASVGTRDSSRMEVSKYFFARNFLIESCLM
jgi:hypothetical protein